MTRVANTVSPGNPKCLHCVVQYAVALWVQQNGERDPGGLPIASVSEIVERLAEVIADTVSAAPNREERRRFERYAHRCLDAALESKRTGKAVPVELDGLHEAEH